jgi:hypothetical protein
LLVGALIKLIHMKLDLPAVSAGQGVFEVAEFVCPTFRLDTIDDGLALEVVVRYPNQLVAVDFVEGDLLRLLFTLCLDDRRGAFAIGHIAGESDNEFGHWVLLWSEMLLTPKTSSTAAEEAGGAQSPQEALSYSGKSCTIR